MKSLLAPLCLLLALAPALIAGRGLVLCVEPDGAVNIETTGGCDGCPDGGASGDAGEPVAAPDSGCPCIDVALDSATTVSRVKDAGAELTWTLLAMLASDEIVGRVAPARGEIVRDVVPCADAARRLVGTVVLLV